LYPLAAEVFPYGPPETFWGPFPAAQYGTTKSPALFKWLLKDVTFFRFFGESISNGQNRWSEILFFLDNQGPNGRSPHHSLTPNLLVKRRRKRKTVGFPKIKSLA
jgi:hypothetical protein